MVNCALLKCGNRSGRDKDKKVFFRLPNVIRHQEEKALELRMASKNQEKVSNS